MSELPDEWWQRLEEPVSELYLPTRMDQWLEQRRMGTLRELAAVEPSGLLLEKNLGRIAVSDTRRILEKRLGMTWEQACQAITNANLALQALQEAEFATRVAVAHAVPLREVDLPTRIRSFAAREGILTVGALWEYLREHPDDLKYVGLKALEAARVVLREFIARLPPTAEERGVATPAIPGLLAGWKQLLDGLAPVDAMVMTRRSAPAGEASTLRELSEMLGVTHERVRQREIRAVKRLRKRAAFCEAVVRRLAEVTGGGAVPLERLANDDWFAGVVEARETLAFILRRVVPGPWRVLRYEGAWLVAPFDAGTLSRAWSDVRHRLSEGEFPIDEEVLRARLRAATAAVAPGVVDLFWPALEPELFSRERDGRREILGYGEGSRHEVLALLRAAERPIRVSELPVLLGRRVVLPDEVWSLGWGLVGLERHFPEPRRWRDALVPRCLEIMESAPDDRQWTTTELLDELREVVEVPPWLTASHLGSLLRRSGEVGWLGYLRVMRRAPGDGEPARLHIHALLVEALEEAGRPLTESELQTRAAKRSGFSVLSLQTALRGAPFVKLAPERWGLLERDTPGGMPAVAAARERIVALLAQRGTGITAHEAWRTIAAISLVHREWTGEIVLSVLRLDPRFRMGTAGRVGLATWESVRLPTLPERLTTWVEEAGGAVAADLVSQRIGELYGAVPPRRRLATLARHAGLRLEGDMVRRRSETAPAGGLEGDAAALSSVVDLT